MTNEKTSKIAINIQLHKSLKAHCKKQKITMKYFLNEMVKKMLERNN